MLKYKYLRIKVANIRYAYDKINNRMHPLNACYYSVQNFLSSAVFQKNWISMFRCSCLVICVVLEKNLVPLKENYRFKVF